MARGITQEQVNGAIEQLLLSGERPTIERVRAALGTGSPNTLTRMLDVWWQGLGSRLTAQRRSAAVPEAPAAVIEAASALWEAALAAGQAYAEAAVAPERAALADVLTKAEAAMASDRAARASLETHLAKAKGEAEAHYAALVMSDQRNSDLQRQVASQQAEIQALSLRIDATLARHHSVMQQAETERAAAATEREALQAHLRQAEDRAYAEVDRIRQELKVSKAQLAAQTREQATALARVEEARRVADLARQSAERESAAAQARMEELERQFTRLRAETDEKPARRTPRKLAAKTKVPATRPPNQ
ncbi:DNA-binding protein [Arenimonas sp. MALMAid1274]|uniref:DNA-binding protein n=1 Tax=Arenimonas sp. MALMAid1274 TaxID=3411630 RepID=UPI003BA13944